MQNRQMPVDERIDRYSTDGSANRPIGNAASTMKMIMTTTMLMTTRTMMMCRENLKGLGFDV
jgi:hypothetical protein